MVLNDICEVYSGYALKEFNDVGEGLPVIKIGNILTDGTLNLEECQYTTECVNEKYYSKNNDVYVALSGATTGKIGIIKSEDRFIINQRVGIVRKKNNDVPNEFIKYFLLRQTDRILQEAAGCAQPNISPKQLGQYEIPVYDDSKMQHIVMVLDNLSKIMHKRNDELSSLDNLIKARFVEMFGDPETSEKYPHVAVKEITEVISGGTPDRKNNTYWENGTVPWVKTTELQNNRLSDIGEYITEKGLNESSAKIVPEGTVLIAMYGQGKTRGMTAILDVPASTNQACACLLPSEKIESEYLWQYMIMSYDRLRNLAQGGNQPNLNGNMIKNFTVLIPSKDKQIEFVEFVKQVDKSKVVVQNALDKAHLLFDSLMQEYYG